MRFATRLVFLLSTILYVAVASAAVTVSVNGVSHTIPQTGEKGWGANVTAWIQAISANTLQPSGGTFTLTADTNFGGSYGLVSTYFKSRTSNISSSGALRLANSDAIGWRNNANSNNLLLSVDSSDRLLFNGVLLPSLSASDFTDSGFRISDDGDSSKKIAFDAAGIGTSTTRTLTVPDASGTLVLNNNTQTLTNKTLSGGSNTFSNIPYSALSLGSSVVNSDISAAAGIGVTKIEALTASRALQTNASGVISVASVTSTELGYLSGVTSAIQTQVDAKVAKSVATAKGDILIGTTNGTVSKKSVGTDGLFLKADSSDPTGVSYASPAGVGLSVVSKTTTYTATTSDDVILASGSAFTITLYAASGNSGKVLRVKKTDSSLSNIITLDGNASETIDGALTTTLNTQYEEVTIICDGSNWHILDRITPSPWVAYTPTFTGFGTVSGVSFFSRRINDTLFFHGTFTCGTATATQARITIGFNGTSANVTAADTTKITSGGQVTGSGFFSVANAVSIVVIPLPSQTYFVMGVQTASTGGYAGANGNGICSSGQTLSISGYVPIAGWN